MIVAQERRFQLIKEMRTVEVMPSEQELQQAQQQQAQHSHDQVTATTHHTHLLKYSFFFFFFCSSSWLLHVTLAAAVPRRAGSRCGG